MDQSILVKLFGFPATLIHGDTLVLDRWIWLKSRLPTTNNEETLIDIGCGTGAFTIGAGLRGYCSLGLSWDIRNQNVAAQRASICKASSVRFEVQDVRDLGTRADLFSSFDVAICFENIEHVLDDRKLIIDIAGCLKPGGRLLLTSPYLLYEPMSSRDKGPFSKIEDGWHVRRGYTKGMLQELCSEAGLIVEEFSFTSGIASQKITSLIRSIARISHVVAWLVTLPLRILPPLFDGVLTPLTQWPCYSICLAAYKPRFDDSNTQQSDIN
jgi:SAM-dependent methyltransferase